LGFAPATGGRRQSCLRPSSPRFEEDAASLVRCGIKFVW
jgi:hypothetical protein